MLQSLSARIFIGLVLGFFVGSLVQYVFPQTSFFQETLVQIFDGIGTMFVHAIMMMVIPLVFFSIVSGVCELKELSSFGRLGGKTFIAYLVNTMFAISVAFTVGMLMQPGFGLNLGATEGISELPAKELPNIFQLIVDIVPSNPVQAFLSGNMLQIIFMALLTGFVLKSMSKEMKQAITFFKTGNRIMIQMITFVMNMAPYGVFALMVTLGATFDSQVFSGILLYIGLILSLLFFWNFLFYPLVVSLLTDISASEFRRATREQALFALSTASSNATIPVTMRTLTKKLHVKPAVAGFGVPLGATMNMGGVSIYITIAALFVANAFGVPIQSSDIPALFFNVFVLAVGSGGVPGGGLVMIGILIHQLGLPVEAFALIAAVDRIIDMAVTSVNVVGDSAVVSIVDRSEP